MKKKAYMAPTMEQYVIETRGMLCASILDSTEETPKIIPTEEEYNGDFSAPALLDMID